MSPSCFLSRLLATRSRHGAHSIAIALSALLAAPAFAHADDDHDHGHNEAAHVHGVVSVDIAADGQDLLITLTAPQADITGFEHAPHDEAEHKAVADAIATLQGTGLFVPSAAAACQQTAVTLDGLHSGDEHAHAHEDDHRHENDAKAEHDGDDHDGHAHEHGGHADVVANYQFRCAQPQALQSIDVLLTKAFPTIHTINVQLALPTGQASRTLKAGETTLTW